jgi:hypothetical protein
MSEWKSVATFSADNVEGMLRFCSHLLGDVAPRHGWTKDTIGSYVGPYSEADDGYRYVINEPGCLCWTTFLSENPTVRFVVASDGWYRVQQRVVPQWEPVKMDEDFVYRVNECGHIERKAKNV